MITNRAPHQPAASSTAQWLLRVNDQVRQFVCGLRGHDAMLHFERSRLSLLCSSCGHDSPGWDLRRTDARADTRWRGYNVAGTMTVAKT